MMNLWTVIYVTKILFQPQTCAYFFFFFCCQQFSRCFSLSGHLAACFTSHFHVVFLLLCVLFYCIWVLEKHFLLFPMFDLQDWSFLDRLLPVKKSFSIRGGRKAHNNGSLHESRRKRWCCWLKNEKKERKRKMPLHLKQGLVWTTDSKLQTWATPSALFLLMLPMTSHVF